MGNVLDVLTKVVGFQTAMDVCVSWPVERIIMMVLEVAED